jgi:hypothetical protein
MEYKILVMDRKELVTRMEQLTGIRARFQPGRTSSYKIDRYIISCNKTLTVPDDADFDMLKMLTDEGLIEPAATEEQISEQGALEHEEPNENSIYLPMGEYTGVTLRNLVKILYIRAVLIQKSTGARIEVTDSFMNFLKDDRCTFSVPNFLKAVAEYERKYGVGCKGIVFTEDAVIITAEQDNKDETHRQAYIDLITCINKKAISGRPVIFSKTDFSNEKFAMRIWLDSIGMTAEEYKISRKTLMKPLTGNSSRKTKEQLEASIRRYLERRKAHV